ncbi:hypothetical protein ACB098_07G066100 [Castanea mollissima]
METINRLPSKYKDGAINMKDLGVTVSNRKSGTKLILQGLSGYAWPGELLAIMGPSGCGKSTLLDSLARRLRSNIRQKGEILINGGKQALAYGTSAYVTQDDTLYSAQLQLPDTMSKSEKKERAETTVKEMGISGGQKRTVSICIEPLTYPKLLFLDEPTSGIDSAASNYVMSRIASLGQRDGIRRTIIASIYQRSSEVFQLFHNLSPFFTLSGFPCPIHQNPSDHFLKTTNKDFQQEYGELETRRSHASFLTQCFVLTKRSFVNMYRDLGYYWLRLIIYIAIGLGLGLVFFNVGHTYASIQARGKLLSFVASFLKFMVISVVAFVISNTISTVPYLILVAVFPRAIAYYLPKLREGPKYFLYFFLVVFACMLLVESLMMIVASIVPNYLMGIITGARIQALMILVGGFFRLPDDLPKPMFKLGLSRPTRMFKNEFERAVFSNDQAGGPPIITGEVILRVLWQAEMGYSKWVNLAILLGMVVIYRLMFLGIIKANEKVKPMTKAFISMSPKQNTQVTVTASSTPLNER